MGFPRSLTRDGSIGTGFRRQFLGFITGNFRGEPTSAPGHPRP